MEIHRPAHRAGACHHILWRVHHLRGDALPAHELRGEPGPPEGRGVRLAAEALGFELADTVGFGDSLNDLEMIETVGYGVCMENGSEALKAVSDLVCPAVEDDGLAQAFAQLGLG